MAAPKPLLTHWISVLSYFRLNLIGNQKLATIEENAQVYATLFML
jgi:hypothetical protein